MPEREHPDHNDAGDAALQTPPVRGEVTSDLDARFGLDDEHAWLEHARAAVRDEPKAPGRLGGYEGLEEIGRGGQGTVYRARQPLTGRIVALKRVGTLTGERAVARFEREVEALTRLAHPSVVTVYGAEVVEGHAVIVMEFVDGVPIDEWAAQVRRESGPGEGWARIVRACADVCAGMAHAHQRGVIHRDLKPSNVMVGADGRARVLDFGVARILGEAPRETVTQFAGTPQFASPEQIAGLEVDARTDVYSLGVLLYELLVGERAFGHAGGLAALMDAIRAGLDSAVSKRVRGVPRDLDWILAMATAVSPGERYATIDAMERDLRALLAGGLVEAHPPSVVYALRKSLRRHWVAATLTGTIGAALVVTSVVMWRSSVRVNEALVETSAALERERIASAETSAALERERIARAEASLEEEIQTGVASLLRAVIRGGNPMALRGNPDMTIREAVDQAAAMLVTDSGSEIPAVDGAFHVALGEVYLGMGRIPEAKRHLWIAHERYRVAYGADHLRAEEPLLYLSRIVRDEGDYASALEVQERIVAMRRTREGEYKEVLLAQALNSLGLTLRYLGRLEEAEAALLEALEINRPVIHAEHENVAMLRSVLAGVYRDMGRGEEAEREARHALAIAMTNHPDGMHPDVGSMQRILGEVLDRFGTEAEAERMLRAGLATHESLDRAQAPDGARAAMALGEFLVRTGRREEGIALLERALAVFERLYPATSPRVTETRGHLERALGGG